MASVAMAAGKAQNQRRPSDVLRIKAGHMLTFESIAGDQELAERHVMKKVLRKTILRNLGCTNLPLTLAYFAFYVQGIYLHEDPTMNYFWDSNFRGHIDEIFGGVNSIDQLWEALLGLDRNQFLGYFVNQHTANGDPRSKNSSMDNWGDWGRIDLYTQIQGAIRFETSRKKLGSYGAPYTCDNQLICDVCRSNEGFEVTGDDTMNLANSGADCGDWGLPSRRLLSEGAGAAAGRPQRAPAGPADVEEAGRRLKLVQATMRTSMPMQAPTEAERFRFWLYATDSQQDNRAKVQYFKDRGWIDVDTQYLQIKLFLLNAELGRARLFELTMSFSFSEGGGIYYERKIEPIFLSMFYSMLGIFVDLAFFIILFGTSLYRAQLVWSAFLKAELFDHVFRLYTAWEWLIILFGWSNVYALYMMQSIANSVNDQLKVVRAHEWQAPDATFTDSVSELFDICSASSGTLANLRVWICWYSLILMFRFFVSFSCQPRLALVVNTMKKVMTDIAHFLVVLAPTFLAYVISGNLTFGRRLEAFSTVTGSLGACARIAFESEYDWADLSAEHYWTSAFWTWSFIILLVLIMLNMMIVIILDVYNEVRESSALSEAVWDTMYYFVVRLWHVKSWVRESEVESVLKNKMDQPIIRKSDIKEEFERIPEPELDLLYGQCRSDMLWEAARDLDKKNLVQLSGSIIVGVDGLMTNVAGINDEEANDPLKSWISPCIGSPAGTLDDMDGFFLTVPVSAKGGSIPQCLLPTDENDISKTEQDQHDMNPAWLKDIHERLSAQRKWMQYTTHSLQEMQWQLQLAHSAKISQTPFDDRNSNEYIL